MTGEEMMVQKFYRCATCNMTEDGLCICEVCITNCHAGHITYESARYKEYIEGFGPGFCDCGEEGSRGIRSCKMLTGKFIHEFVSFFLLNLSITYFNY